MQVLANMAGGHVEAALAFKKIKLKIGVIAAERNFAAAAVKEAPSHFDRK